MKNLIILIGLVLVFAILPAQKISATTSVATLSTFTSSGITFNQHSLSGPYEDYFEVDSIEKLYMIRFYRSSGFILTRDLDFDDDSSYLSSGSGFLQGNFDGDTSTSGSIKDQLTSGRGWLPIGYSRNNINGSGYTISNLYINNPDALSGFGGGLFYELRGLSNNKLKFENISLSGVSVSSSNQNLGVITGFTDYVKFNNVQVTGQLTSTYPGNCGGSAWAWAGGIAGRASTSTNVVDTGINLEISAISCAVGGMFGQFSNGVISNSFFQGTISNTRNNTGGFIGNLTLSSSSEPTIIKNSLSNVIINSTSTYSGGIIGSIQTVNGPLELLNVYSIGLIKGSSYTAGLIGGTAFPDFSESKIENVFAAIVTSGTGTRQAFSKTNDFTNPTVQNNFVFSDIDASNRTNLFDGVEITTSGNLFLRSWQETVLGSGSTAWYMLHSVGDELPYLPILLRSGLYEPLDNQPIIAFNNISSFENSGLSVTSNLLDANTFQLAAPTYTVDYVSNGGSAVTQDVIPNGSAITNNPLSTREGYLFGGWYTDTNLTSLFDLNTILTSDLTLYAKWTLTTFTITLDSLGGSAVGPVSGNEGDVVGLPKPTREDYDFVGWQNSEGQLISNPYTVKNINETFRAKWSEVNYTITVIPLVRTYYLEIEEPKDIDFGEDLILPAFDAYEMFGRIKTDLSDYVSTTGEIGSIPGEYPITYTLTYEDIVITKEVLVRVVDNVPPTLSIDLPNTIFYKDEILPLITVNDNAPGEVNVIAIKELDIMRPGLQSIIYDAVDASGNLTRVIQEVTVVMPEVRYEEVMVNNQKLIIVADESQIDFSTMELYMAQSDHEPNMTSAAWQLYENQDFTSNGPGQRVFIQLRDATGNSITRESIELFWHETVDFSPRRIRAEVVYPEVEPSRYIPWPLLGGTSFGAISIGSYFVYFLKRRK